MNSIDLVNYINTILTIICTFLFLLLPYFISIFTVKKVGKSKGAYGQSNSNKSNLVLKCGFVLWFTIIAYYVTSTVITDIKVRYVTYALAIITIVMFISSIIREIKIIKRG